MLTDESATAITYLRKATDTSASRSLCYFFFRTQQQLGITHLLGHIVKSLCSANVEKLRLERLSKLRKLFMGKYLQGETPSEDDLLDFLSGITERTYIVIDAIDEYGKEESLYTQIKTRRQVAKSLSRLVAIPNVRLLVSCRDGPFLDEIKSRLWGSDSKADAKFCEISMQQPMVNADIEKLITERLDENLGDFLRENPEWRSKIRDRIKPDGMFLLVARQLDIIEQKILESSEWSDIEASLNELPEDVNGIYTLILNRILVSNKIVALTILKWLICAQRPLRASELKDFISTIHPGTFNIMDTFPNLLLKRKDNDTENALIEFAHDTSIREYLHSDNSGEFHIELREADDCFARTCISFLSTSMPEDSHGSDHGDCRNCPMSQAAFEYAANNWFRHALSAASNTSSATRPHSNQWPYHEKTWLIEIFVLCSRIAVLALYLWTALVSRFPITVYDEDSTYNTGNQVIKHPMNNKDSLSKWSSTMLSHLNQHSGSGEPRLSEIRRAIFPTYNLLTDLLLAHGAYIQAPMGQYDALMAASTQNYPGMIAVLLGLKPDESPGVHWWPDINDNARGTQANEVVAAAIVQRLLDHNANPDARNKFQQSALHLAAGSNQKMIVNVLVDRVGNAEAKDYCGATALHWAAAGGCKEAVGALATKGSDINARCVYQKAKVIRRPQHIGNISQKKEDFLLINAAENFSEAAMLELINRGANPRAVDQYGSTALHWVSCRGNDRLARLLIDLGADVNAVRPFEKFARTPLIEATRNNTVTQEMIRYYLQAGAEPNLEDSTWFENRTALHEAAMAGKAHVVRALLEYGADANIRDLKGQTAADLARANGFPQIQSLLEKNSQGISARGGRGETALHMAAENDRYEVVAELLKHGADVHMVADNGRSVLHSAAGGGSAKLFSLLMDKGASPSSLADNRWSVLHEAACKGNTDVVKLLLRCPTVGLNAKDSNGEAPLTLAARNKHEDILKLLLEQPTTTADPRNWRGHTPLQDISIAGDVATALLLLARGDVDIESRDGHYLRSPLIHAAMEGHLDMVQCLLDRGADVNVVDKFGTSSLEYAAAGGHQFVLEALHRGGALKMPGEEISSPPSYSEAMAAS